MKYLCFDLGLSHTGVAISHEGVLSEPLKTINEKDPLKLFNQILRLIQAISPDQVLIGQPQKGEIHTLAQNLINFLQPQTNTRLNLVPEDKSTRRAEIGFIQSKTTLPKRQRDQHQVVAAHLLQDFLDSL